MKILEFFKNGKLNTAKNGLYNKLSELANDALDSKKVEIAQSYFGQKHFSESMKNEESLNELSKKTFGSYIKKASIDTDKD